MVSTIIDFLNWISTMVNGLRTDLIYTLHLKNEIAFDTKQSIWKPIRNEKCPANKETPREESNKPLMVFKGLEWILKEICFQFHLPLIRYKVRPLLRKAWSRSNHYWSWKDFFKNRYLKPKLKNYTNDNLTIVSSLLATRLGPFKPSTFVTERLYIWTHWTPNHSISTFLNIPKNWFQSSQAVYALVLLISNDLNIIGKVFSHSSFQPKLNSIINWT